MLTVKNEQLKKQFDKYNIIPPSKKNEDWLYYDLETILNEESKESNKTTNVEKLFEGNFLYFKNGELLKKQLNENIQYQTLNNTEQNENDFIQLALNTCEKQLIEFKNTKESLKIIYESTFGTASTNIECKLNHSEIEIERVFINSETNIINNFLSLSLEHQSTLTINEINNENDGHILDFVNSTLENDCHLAGLNQSYLSNNSRFENKVYLNGENSTARLNGLSINKKDKQSFYNTHVFHNVGNNESHQLFKSINQEDALFEYNGKVTVKKDAQQINSYQLNQNILLDEYATIHSRPQLFIDADDVKCSHGSTTGDLNKEELFYLMSRGLDEITSKKMVLRAFVEEVFQEKNFRKHSKNINEILNKII